MNIDELKAELKQLKDEKYHLLKLINHDIRSPFNRVYALLQLFEMENKDISGMQKEYVDSMYLSILSGLEMIQNLRDMREIDAGNVEIDKVEFDLSDVIQKSIRTFSKQLELKNQSVKTEGSNDQILVISDEYYVQRIIENILSNAIKFSKQGKEINVFLHSDDKYAEIVVQDAGDGIKQEEESLLFQKFSKLSSPASGGEGCLGLGLYNTQYFLTKLNGSITFNRQESIGSKFVIQIPKK